MKNCPGVNATAAKFHSASRLASARAPALSREARRARRKFLEYFPGGFHDGDYVASERTYKWDAHKAWMAALGPSAYRRLLDDGRYQDIAAAAVRIESRTNLLFSFEKMALRDAVRSIAGARSFAIALDRLLHADEPLERRFDHWVEAVGRLPRRQTRVLTWPLATVFGFIAQPRVHFFLKPNVTRAAARRYGAELPYVSRPSWTGYADLLRFVGRVRRDLRDLRPRDMIDLQSFLWVQGSDEYPD